MPRRRAISTSAAAAAIVILIIIAGVFAYLAFTRPPQVITVTSPTTITTAPTTTTTTPTLAVPDFVKANTYVLESPANFQWLDPHVSYYSYDYVILQNVYETLLWYNGTSSTQVIPWLAENWTQVSPTRYIFHLRKGITFQDGTPFNATAVWFSLNRLLVMDGTAPTGVHGSQAAWILQQLLNTSLSSALGGTPSYDRGYVDAVLAQNFVEVIDTYTVAINLMTPSASFPYLIAGEWAAIVSPSWVLAHDFPQAIRGPHDIDYTAYFVHQAGNGTTSLNLPENGAKAGTGPYYIASVNPTTYEIVLKANPNYWGGPPGFQFGPIGKPKIETIDFKVVADFSTRLLDLKAGKATQIAVPATDIYAVIDRDIWLGQRRMVSIIPGVSVYGPYSEYTTFWLNFNTNVTDTSGRLLEFQPFADIRFRLAVASAVNLTDIAISVANGLVQVANWIIPPGTAPEGSYSPTARPAWSFNLTRAEQLLLDAQKHPLTSFTYYNGTPIPPGIVDNSFGPDKPRTIALYYQAGGTAQERLLTTVATNLNRISARNNLGLTFTVVPVPAGTLYSLASRHQVYAYAGGWLADYNWVTDWLGPMFRSTGTYFSWNLWNVTELDRLVDLAFKYDQNGNITGLIEVAQRIGALENQNAYYFLWWYPLAYTVVSSWVTPSAVYYNPALSGPPNFLAIASFAPPSG
jgi:peptide/nickel transport system substrate-binding protein